MGERFVVVFVGGIRSLPGLCMIVPPPLMGRIWPISGTIAPSSGQCWSNLAEFGQDLVELGPIWPRPGRLRTNVVGLRATVGRTWPISGQIRPNSGGRGPVWIGAAGCGRGCGFWLPETCDLDGPGEAGYGRVVKLPERCSPDCPESRPRDPSEHCNCPTYRREPIFRPKFSMLFTEFCRIWSCLAEFDVGRLRPMFSRIQPNSTKIRPKLAKLQPKLANIGQFRSISAKHGPNPSKFGKQNAQPQPASRLTGNFPASFGQLVDNLGSLGRATFSPVSGN